MEIIRNKIASSAIRRGGGKKGFSLLELLLYVAILSILVVVVSNIFVSLSKSNAQAQSKNEVNSAVGFVTELLRQDIKNASVISVPIAGTGDSCVPNVSYTAGSTPGTSTSLTLTRAGTVIIYDNNQGTLRRKEGSNPYVNLTNSNIIVSTPTFTRIENVNPVFCTTNVAVRVDMTFNYNSASPDWVYSDPLQITINSYNAY